MQNTYRFSNYYYTEGDPCPHCSNPLVESHLATFCMKCYKFELGKCYDGLMTLIPLLVKGDDVVCLAEIKNGERAGTWELYERPLWYFPAWFDAPPIDAPESSKTHMEEFYKRY